MMANAIPTSMHTVQYLLEGLTEHLPSGEVPVDGLSLDNRKTRPGDLFCACAGTHTHGLLYALAAFDAGAIAVAYEEGDCLAEQPELMEALTTLQDKGILTIPVSDLRNKLGIIASRFYARPSSQQFVIGITGTNGKTSCAQFIAEALSSQARCGVLGTLGNGVYGQLQDSATTTPDAISLQQQLAQLCEQGVKNVVMETSSHGLVQGRVNGVDFNVAVFTNLSRDHLDYHESMESYAQAKRMLFDMPGLDYAVINIDDEYGRQLLREVPASVQVVCYGMAETHDKFASTLTHPLLLGCVTASELTLAPSGLQMQVATPWGEGELHSSLLGRFNASNLLAALSVLLLRGYSVQDATTMLANVHTVPGRMQARGGEAGLPHVVIDYAHTPDALRAVLSALREHTEGKLICVFGCGGDRDRGKRPLMGAEAEQLADKIILTDDNPRSEQPAAIISDICEGMQHPGRVRIEHDRGRAIRYALASATPQDIVLVAGKGHEDYQIIGEQRLPFSDSEVVEAWLAEQRS
jgi:UDP-N-acetylmuramoyl-L-alanyl-D-glutamate--2,6-diaminopimelate ligase